MGFWNNVCTYVLALLSQSPVGLYQQESLTAPLPFFDHESSLSSPPHLTPNLDGIYAPEIFNPHIPSTQGVANVYNSEFITANTCNSPKDRKVWCNHTSIKTDYEIVELVPDTGKTNYITLVLTSGEKFCGDGYCRPSTMLINGTYPGPLIRGSWGDWFEIKVINKLSNCNGTSIHWHGVRQWNTVWEDGVAGVTQCPIAPGHSQTYRWRATQYGTTWYHSHFSLQYADGLAGPLIIDGPTSMNYDEDKGPMMLTDWYHDDAFGLYYQEVMAVPPAAFLAGAPSVLINGQGAFTKVTNNGTDVEFGCKVGEPHCFPQKASTYKTDIKPSKDGANPRYYKYHIINMSTVTHFSFWIDGHNFWIVATDFVPIKPKLMNFLNVAIGQRYDIIIEAKAESTLKGKWGGHPNFWIKMRLCDKVCVGDPCPDGDCEYVECRQGILSYDAKSLDSPDFNSKKPKAPTTSCTDPDREDLKPIVQRDLRGEVSANMAFHNPFEVDRRPGTQNATEVFGKSHDGGKEVEHHGAADTDESSMKDHYGDHDGPIPPPEFGEPGEEEETHLWDFGSSHTDPEHPNGRYVSFMIDWANATLGLAGQNISADTWNPRFVPIVLEKEDKWAVFAIVANWTQRLNHGVPAGKAVPGAAHPIHLHGHDFVVLAQSSNTFVYGQKYGLDLINPARRDVVMLPANGFVIIGFKTDNPGTWLMHCHIAWHASSGLALQWVERPNDIPALMERDPRVLPEFEERCQKWRDHEATHCEWKKGFRAEQDDSGI